MDATTNPSHQTPSPSEKPRPPVRMRRVTSLEAGDEASVSEITLGSHTGTHVDAPAHLLRGGAAVDALDLERLIGVAVVVHVPGARHITAATLEALRLPEECRRLLFRTHNSDAGLLGGKFHPDYVALQADAGFSLHGRDSRRFEGAEQLVSLGLMRDSTAWAAARAAAQAHALT